MIVLTPLDKEWRHEGVGTSSRSASRRSRPRTPRGRAQWFLAQAEQCVKHNPAKASYLAEMAVKAADESSDAYLRVRTRRVFARAHWSDGHRRQKPHLRIALDALGDAMRIAYDARVNATAGDHAEWTQVHEEVISAIRHVEVRLMRMSWKRRFTRVISNTNESKVPTTPSLATV